MGKTSLTDLNEYLFEALDRITNEDLKGEELESEIKRADAVTDIAKTIIDNGHLTLNVMKHLDEYGRGDSVVCNLLEAK